MILRSHLVACALVALVNPHLQCMDVDILFAALAQQVEDRYARMRDSHAYDAVSGASGIVGFHPVPEGLSSLLLPGQADLLLDALIKPTDASVSDWKDLPRHLNAPAWIVETEVRTCGPGSLPVLSAIIAKRLGHDLPADAVSEIPEDVATIPLSIIASSLFQRSVDRHGGILFLRHPDRLLISDTWLSRLGTMLAHDREVTYERTADEAALRADFSFERAAMLGFWIWHMRFFGVHKGRETAAFVGISARAVQAAALVRTDPFLATAISLSETDADRAVQREQIVAFLETAIRNPSYASIAIAAILQRYKSREIADDIAIEPYRCMIAAELRSLASGANAIAPQGNPSAAATVSLLDQPDAQVSRRAAEASLVVLDGIMQRAYVVLEMQGKHAQALAMLEECHQHYPGTLAATSLLAVQRLAARDVAASELLIEEIARSSADSHDRAAAMAIILQHAGSTDDTTIIWQVAQRILALDPDEPYALLQRAMHDWADGKRDQARSLLRKLSSDQHLDLARHAQDLLNAQDHELVPAKP